MNRALEESRAWRGYENYPKSMNSYRSAYFCYQAGEQLDDAFKRHFPARCLQRKLIGFDGEHKKTPGEWLLDIVWCEETRPDARSASSCPSKIYGALECESSTSTKAFFTDFAKLVHVRSRIKIFLAGVDQKLE